MKTQELTDEQRQNRALWVVALRSGDYAQTRSHLKDAKGHCCLGVACEVLTPDEWMEPNIAENPDGLWALPANARKPNGPQQRTGTLPMRHMRMLGLTDHQTGDAMRLNDAQGASFSQIADWIELGMPAGWTPKKSDA